MNLSPFEQWWYNSLPHRLYIRLYLPHFLRACPQPFRGQVLEVGSGRGWSSQRILETFPQVELTATDVDSAATHAFARLKGRYGQRLKVREADIMNLPFDRSSFDIVIATSALRHVADVPTAIRQFLRVLRPGGFIGITDQGRLGRVLLTLVSGRPALDRQRLEAIVRTQGAEVMVAKGQTKFMVWARKPYPTTIAPTL